MSNIEKINPFEYDKANSLRAEQIAEYFIDDHNFARFLPTGKNILLKGSRGTGKTMAMLYFSFKVQYEYSTLKNKEIDFSKIGIHIPCKNPIFQKQEYLLPYNEKHKPYIIAEHFLVLNILFEICNSLKDIREIQSLEEKNVALLREKLQYLLDVKIPNISNIFESLMLFAQRESEQTQKFLNEQEFESFYSTSYSFNSLIIPLLSSIHNFPLFENSHFMFMFDDLQDLNIYQKKVINSWIAFRDNKQFSFKLATTERNPILITSSGGTILENHDFISIDMIKKFQSKGQDFYDLAEKIIQKRLDLFKINVTAKEFLPTSQSFLDDLEKSKEIAREKAREKFPNPVGTQILDYVSKYGRAEYFRSRKAQANRPPYSGLETLIDISTGVIRQLLIPIYWMYDKELSKHNNISENPITSIPVSTQTEIIMEESNKYWERLKNIYNEVEGCSKEDATRLNNFFDNLMVLFRERLLDESISEPRAISFIITSQEDFYMKDIDRLMDIAMRGNFLYSRLATSKVAGKQDVFYIPNRFLLPARLLDPHGQYARVSLKSKDIYATAIKNIKLPKENKTINDGQRTIDF